MTRFNAFLRRVAAPTIALVLVLGFVCAPLSESLRIQRAEATWISWDPGNFVANLGDWIVGAESAASDAVTAEATGSLETKEYALDGIAWGVVNLLLEEMIRSITQWVNNGFQGSPAFVTNLQGFLTGLADRVAGNFIYGSSLNFLCSPFKLNIQLALDLQYNKQRAYQARCSLSGVVQNMEGFLGGNFLEGGWNGWNELTLNTQSNPYGAMLEAQAGLSATIKNAKSEEVNLLSFGSGFLTQKDRNGNTRTPGVVIQTQLNEGLSIPGERLTVADEIDELIGALLAQLVRTVLSDSGLLGVTESSGGNASYLDQIAQQTSSQGFGGSAATSMQDDVAATQEYLALQQQVVAMITEASTYKARTYGAENTCHSGALTASLQNRLTSAQQAVFDSLTVIDTLNVYIADLNTLGNQSTPPATRTALLEKYTAATTVEAQSNLLSQYSDYKRSGVIPSTSQSARLRIEIQSPLRDEISNFTAAIDTACQMTVVNTNTGG